MLYDWLTYLTRWLHLIAGIAWIGNSFYFMWLDANIAPPAPAREGVEGSLWMVHSGGFYQVEKRKIRPGEVPSTLHWFFLEATFTLLTGLLLLSIVYYWRAEAFLIDPAVLALSPGQAIGLALSLLVGSWLIYDLLWISPLAAGSGNAATAVSLGLLVGLAYTLCHVFGGRAAFIHFGAILGAIMVVNVWVRILPAQRKMIDATTRGVAPDLSHGLRAKRRSVHNSYLTLPVLFMMLSNHQPAAFGHPRNWLVLLGLAALGMTMRHLMIRRTQHRALASPGLAVAGSAAVLFALALPPGRPELSAADAVPDSTIRTIVANRCVSCHSTHPTDDVFKIAPKGLILEELTALRAHAPQVRMMAIQTKAMPLANKTGMTDAERGQLDRWLGDGK